MQISGSEGINERMSSQYIASNISNPYGKLKSTVVWYNTESDVQSAWLNVLEARASLEWLGNHFLRGGGYRQQREQIKSETYKERNGDTRRRPMDNVGRGISIGEDRWTYRD